MKNVSYKVGMLVDHPNRPQWGPGKVVCVDATKVHVFFRDAMERTARPIVFAVAPLEVAASQSDAVLDHLPDAVEHVGSWHLPASYKHEALGDPPATPKKKKAKDAAPAASGV
jgi:hypothetical protein